MAQTPRVGEAEAGLRGDLPVGESPLREVGDDGKLIGSVIARESPATDPKRR